MEATQVIPHAAWEKLPPSGVLLVVVILLLCMTGVQIVRLILDWQRHKRDGENCNFPHDLGGQMRSALDRQVNYRAEIGNMLQALTRASENQTNTISDFITYLRIHTDKVTEALAELRARRR